MIPLHDIELYYIHHNLKGDDNQLEKHIVNEVIDFNAVVTSYLGLLIKQPQQNDEVTTVKQ